jgi:hypothetical protein
MKPEIQAAIVAGVFTLIGVAVGVGLEQWSQDTVIQAGRSSVFQNRWEEYIQGGIIPWNEDYRYMRSGIKEYFPTSAKNFEDAHESFKNLHKILLEYHRAKGSPDPRIEKQAAVTLDTLGREADVLVDSLLKPR